MLMLQSKLIDPIFSPLRSRVLATLLLNPERKWYMLEIAKHLGVARSTLQGELSALVHSEILTSQPDGNRIYYQANIDCPILPELQGLLIKTVGLIEILKNVLSPLTKKIETAFIYGSFAQAAELAGSDIDLFIIGSIGLAEVAGALRSAENQIGREINPVIFSIPEVMKKLASKEHFVTSVISTQKIFLIGADSDLAKTFSGK